MVNIDDLCMGCMRERNGEKVCPLCGYAEGTPQSMHLLPVKTVLQGRYIVGKELYENGEGITYIGWDKVLSSAIEIREFFPNTVVSRGKDNNVDVLGGCESVFDGYKEQFLELSRSLGKVRELESVPTVYDIFMENGTAYRVSEHVAGIKLIDYLKQKGSPLTTKEVRSLFIGLISNLITLHNMRIIHRGISPETIYFTKDKKLVLTDFCIGDVRKVQTDLTPALFSGYSPLELYDADVEDGVWTDVYGIASTILTASTGMVISEAPRRLVQGTLEINSKSQFKITESLEKTLIRALKVNPLERTKRMDIFKSEFAASENVAKVLKTPVAKPEPQEQANKNSKVSTNAKGKKKKGPNYPLIAMGITCAVLLVVAVALVVALFKDKIFHKEETSNLPEESIVANAAEDSKEEVQSSEYTAPSLIGKSLEALQQENPYKYCKIQFAGTMFDDKAPEGTIVWQSIEARKAIKKDETINVLISAGPYNVPMPSIVGKDLNAAVIEILKSGLKYEVVQQSGTSYPSGIVSNANYEAGTDIAHGTKVVIYVSNDQANNQSSESLSQSGND